MLANPSFVRADTQIESLGRIIIDDHDMHWAVNEFSFVETKKAFTKGVILHQAVICPGWLHMHIVVSPQEMGALELLHALS